MTSPLERIPEGARLLESSPFTVQPSRNCAGSVDTFRRDRVLAAQSILTLEVDLIMSAAFCGGILPEAICKGAAAGFSANDEKLDRIAHGPNCSGRFRSTIEDRCVQLSRCAPPRVLAVPPAAGQIASASTLQHGISPLRVGLCVTSKHDLLLFTV